MASQENKTQPPSSCQSALNQATTYILQGAYTLAEQALQGAEKFDDYQKFGALIVERFQLIIRYERFERMLGEVNIYITDVLVLKEKSGGMPRKEVGMLEPTGIPELDHFIVFLNERYQNWLWRTTRNLIRGVRFSPDPSGISAIFQREIATCQKLFQEGKLDAGIAAADFCKSGGLTQDAIQWLTQTEQNAEQKGDLSTQANCSMCAGDWLSAPYSSPIMWNFALEASSLQNSSLSPSVENHEFQPPSPENLQQARQFWDQAMGLFQRVENKMGMAQLHLRFAYLASLDMHWQEVLEQAQIARSFFEDERDSLYANLAETYIILALAAQNQISEALIKAKTLGDWGLQSGNHSWVTSLGLLMARFARHFNLRLGLPELALKIYRVARTLQLCAQNALCAAQHLTDLSEIYKAIGQTDASITHIEQSVDEIETFLAHDLKDFKDESNTYLHLCTGVVMLLSDNFNLGMRRMDVPLMDRSITRMKLACEKIEKSATPEDLANMSQIGQVFGLYQQMAEQAQVLIPLYRGKHLRDRGDLVGFEKEWNKAYLALSDISAEQQAILAVNVWGMKRNWEKAGEAMRTYLALGGVNSGFLDELLQSMQRFGEQGQEEIQQQHYRDLTLSLSGLVRSKQFAEALNFYEKLQNLFGETWWSREDAPWQMLSDCGEMMEGLGRLEEALSIFDLGIHQLEQRRKQLIQDASKVGLADTQNTRYLYIYAARAAMKLEQKERSLQYAELGKARGLLDLIAENHQTFALGNIEWQTLSFKRRELGSHFTLLTNQLAQLRSFDNPDPAILNALTNQIHELEAQQLEIEQDMAKISLSHIPLTKPDFDFETIVKRLEEETLLLEYLVSSEDLMIWAVNKNGIVYAKNYKIEDWVLMSEINQLRDAMTQRKPWFDAAQILAKRLLSPVFDALGQHKTVIIVAHGPLHNLPFQVLPWDDKLLLGKSHKISYLPSATALTILDKVKPLNQARVLAVGNPTGDLEAADAEVRFLAQQYGQDALLLIGAEATEEKVRANIAEAELLHFATHGYLSEDAPLQSSLVLTNKEHLTLKDLMGIKLSAELVVLSACDTGRGASTGGDDVLGLSRGLISSGAKSAIVSLWKVNDISTALLMGHFYKQLKLGKPLNLALQSAQVYLSEMDQEQLSKELSDVERAFIGNVDSERDLSNFKSIKTESLISDYSHPYFWAGFILIGGN